MPTRADVRAAGWPEAQSSRCLSVHKSCWRLGLCAFRVWRATLACAENKQRASEAARLPAGLKTSLGKTVYSRIFPIPILIAVVQRAE
jgi:hypothetical protein